MKRKLRGFKRSDIQLDFNLYRVSVPIPGVAGPELSVIDIWPQGVERTIIFVHGYAGCAETWEYQINHFSREYRVVAPDLRGHGQSDAPFTQYTMPELVADLHAITQALGFPDEFILAGHSFGGSICVEYANAHPEKLDALILIATGGEYPLPRAVSLISRIPTAAFRPLWRYRPRWNAELHVMKRMLLNNMRKWQGWHLLRNIRTPTLVITGERDTYFPRRVFEDVGKMVPDAEVIELGGSKHKVQLERHRAVNRAIERFVTEGRRGSWREQRIDSGPLSDRPWLTHYAKEIPLTVPIPRQPLDRFLESAADWVPKRTATIFYGSRLTYRQLNRQVNQFAHALRGLGIRPGQRVMIVLPNAPQMIIAYYATLRIGGVVTYSSPDTDLAEIVREAGATGAKVLITLRCFGRLTQAMREGTEIDKIVLADICDTLPSKVRRQLLLRWSESDSDVERQGDYDANTYLMERLMMDAAWEPPSVDVSPEDLAAILWTSGTVDEPKGVCLTHANLVANALQTRHWIPDLRYGEETFLTAVPLTHSYGMTTAMNIPIAVGATIVLLPSFDLDQVLNHVRKYRPTIFPGVPPMYMAINQAPDVRSYGLASIKACISGAAPLPVEVQEAFEKITRGRLVEGYGLTEASPVTHANPLYGVRKVGSIGVPIPNTDAKIVDLETEEELGPGEVGELAVKGPQVMQGYWNRDREGETSTALRGEWLHTGDIAVMDKDGYFFVLNRKHEIISVDGQRVFPRDVEEVLYENNKVLEAAVVGVERDSGERRPKAFVAPRPDADLSEEELLDLCRRRLNEYAVPVEIEFRDKLPKSYVGKVQRRVLLDKGGR